MELNKFKLRTKYNVNLNNKVLKTKKKIQTFNTNPLSDQTINKLSFMI